MCSFHSVRGNHCFNHDPNKDAAVLSFVRLKIGVCEMMLHKSSEGDGHSRSSERDADSLSDSRGCSWNSDEAFPWLPM